MSKRELDKELKGKLGREDDKRGGAKGREEGGDAKERPRREIRCHKKRKEKKLEGEIMQK